MLSCFRWVSVLIFSRKSQRLCSGLLVRMASLMRSAVVLASTLSNKRAISCLSRSWMLKE